MNYLAHLFLAGRTPESLLGNLAGDFVKGRLHGRLPPAVERGIIEHRRIDEYTDTHPAVASVRRAIALHHGHYSRVIADVFFDHFLACDWAIYSRQPLGPFLQDVYAALDPLAGSMPGRLKLVYPRMRDEGWLATYGEIESIRTALHYLSLRFSRGPRLEEAANLLVSARGTLQGGFRRFFPDVVVFANRLRSLG